MNPENIDTQDDNHLLAERHMPSMNQSKTQSFGQKAILFIGGFVVLIALIAVNGGFSTDTSAQDAERHHKPHKITNHLGEAPQIVALPPKVVEQPVDSHVIPPKPVYNGSKHQKQEQTPEERKIASAVLEYTHQAPSKSEVQIAGLGQEASQDPLAQSLQPTFLDGATANLIPDRNLFITKGTFIECVLETAMSSDVLGMTSCRIARDVYSTSGNIVLLERGTRIIGEYKGGLQHGQSRLFVLWNRAETPNGVIIDLASGGTDALGRAGHDGFIDSHFYERFSGAIMLSLIDDIGSYAVNQASNTQNGQIQFSGTAGSAGDAAGVALENSINIRPTFYKNQGDTLRIFVARDLDFRGVYALKARY